MTTIYEVTTRDDRESGNLRGISHGLGGQPLPDGLRIHVYAIENRIADLFEEDCEADDAVVSYRIIAEAAEDGR